MRAWLGKRLRYLADRIDDDHAFRAIGLSFEYVDGGRIRIHSVGIPTRHGCQLWYQTHEYEKAWPDDVEWLPPKVGV